MARPKKKRRITEGGMTGMQTASSSNKSILRNIEPDIILQMPELFYFDMSSYISSLNAAKAIDFYNRSRLYDMFESALLDLHLSGIIDKRRIGVSRIPIEFRRNGKPDENVNKEIRSPWFRKFIKDVLMSKFWGYALFQFYRDDKDRISYYKVPYKHFDPVRRMILRYQSDTTGIPVEAFENVLFVGDDPRDLGMLAELLPMVLYKRANMGDWAQFCQIFGMPIREYTYDAGDEEARKRLLQDARRQGANAVYIHPKESNLNLIESANKSGTVDLYERFKNACNTEMSVRVLGNTLTTDAKSNGTQALGVVHQEEEDQLKADDRDFILDVLNYDMADIFSALGINTEGGEFTYIKNRNLNPNQQVDVIQKVKTMGVPVSDDYIYETLLIDKPEDYESMKEEMRIKEENNRKLQHEMAGKFQAPDDGTTPYQKRRRLNADNNMQGWYNRAKQDFTNWLSDFFGVAPKKKDGALPF